MINPQPLCPGQPTHPCSPLTGPPSPPPPPHGQERARHQAPIQGWASAFQPGTKDGGPAGPLLPTWACLEPRFSPPPQHPPPLPGKLG